MKTITNKSNSLIKVLSFTFVFTFIGFSVFAQKAFPNRFSNLRGLIAEYTISKTPNIIMIAETSYTFFIEDYVAAELAVEDWMINDKFWTNKNTSNYDWTVTKPEAELEIEDWMVKNFEVNNKKCPFKSAIKQSEMQLEDWMFIVFPEDIINSLIAITILQAEPEVEIENWMSDPKLWNKK